MSKGGPPFPPPNAYSANYTGNCHCGAIRFACKLSPPLHPEDSDPRCPESELCEVMRCNCSICTKSGYLLVYPFQRDFRWTRGEDKIKSYYFGAKTKAQWFCGECGSSIGIDLTSLGEVHGGTKYGINVSRIVSSFVR